MELEPLRIVADDRENAGGVIAELRRRPDVLLEVRRLMEGDFIVEDRVLVERKTLVDFAASVMDARLFRQVAALTRGVRRAALMLEGTGPWLDGVGGFSRESIQGALVTTSIFYGLPVLHSRDANETARLLVCLGRQAGRVARGGLPRPGYRPKGRLARQLFVLQGLPGVGPERAKRLLDRFGSIRAVAAAPAEDLGEVEGIGSRTAAKIRWVLD